MTGQHWSSGSFQGGALYESRSRKEAIQRKAEQAPLEGERQRQATFVRLMQPVLDEYWSRLQDTLGDGVTEAQYDELHFSLIDAPEQTKPVLSVETQCPTCGQVFASHPIKNRADVGDVLARLQQHPDCVPPTVPEVRAMARNVQRGDA
jgi:hypothetical protein